MKRFFALFALFAVLLVFAGSAMSCGRNDKTEDPYAIDPETRELYDTVVMTIDGVPVIYEKYRYYFHYLATAFAGDDEDYFTSDPTHLEELREAVLEELKLERALCKLADGYGITITEENWKSVDDQLQQLDYYYQTNYGVPFRKDLADNYATYDFYRNLVAYGQFIQDKTYEYIYDRDNKVIDFSDSVIEALVNEYNCTLHIMLTTTNYSTEEKTLELAQRLYRILTAAEEAEKSLTENSTREEVVAAIEKVETAYEAEKEEMSYVEGFSGYMGYLAALKEELTSEGGHPCFAYLKTLTDKLSGNETPVSTLKAFADKLVENGIDDAAKEDYTSAWTIYSEMIKEAKKAYTETGAEYPASAQLDALYGLEFVGAVLEDKVVPYAKKTLGAAFSNAVLVFGEDREDPEQGVYFKKGDIEGEFEKAYFELEMGEMSQPVKTEYGIHLILRKEADYAYFSESLYESYAVNDFIQQVIDGLTVVYGDIYETITPETLK